MKGRITAIIAIVMLTIITGTTLAESANSPLIVANRPQPFKGMNDQSQRQDGST